MKWITTFLAMAMIAIACEKSPMTNEQGIVAAATSKANGLVGTWTLVQYYQDNGDGHGQWITPDFSEAIIFGEDGSFSSTPTFPLYSYGYKSYIAKETLIAFYPATSSNGNDDVYGYVMESPTQLLFYPRCRETCTRRYVLK